MSAKRFIESDLQTVGDITDLVKYVDYVILSRIYKVFFYSRMASRTSEAITLDLAEEVFAVTRILQEKRKHSFELVAAVIDADPNDLSDVIKRIVVRRYGSLEIEGIIKLAGAYFSELDLMSGNIDGGKISCYTLPHKTIEYIGRLALQFDLFEKQKKMFDEMHKGVDSFMGGSLPPGFPDPSKLFKSLFEDNEDKLRKENDDLK